MDLITQLPRTKSGKDAIASFDDLLTKVGHLHAVITTISSPRLAQVFLQEVVRLHGVSRIFISNRAPRFTGSLWRALWQQFFGIECRLSTAYHPQTVGMTQRTSRTLEQLLRAFVSPSHIDWDLLLPVAEFAYITARQEST